MESFAVAACSAFLILQQGRVPVGLALVESKCGSHGGVGARTWCSRKNLVRMRLQEGDLGADGLPPDGRHVGPRGYPGGMGGSGGSGRGHHRLPLEVSEQLAVAVLRLQQTMDEVVARLEVLETLLQHSKASPLSLRRASRKSLLARLCTQLPGGGREPVSKPLHQ